MMQVRFFGTLRRFAEAKAIEVELEPGETVKSLLGKVTTQCPALKDKVLDEEGNLRNSVHVLVNGRSIRYLDGLDGPVEESDRVAVFPAVGGG
jgi:molybdopterin synthase sulfur carrier subunit